MYTKSKQEVLSTSRSVFMQAHEQERENILKKTVQMAYNTSAIVLTRIEAIPPPCSGADQTYAENSLPFPGDIWIVGRLQRLEQGTAGCVD